MLDYVENQINISFNYDSKQRINSSNKIKKKIIKGTRKLDQQPFQSNAITSHYYQSNDTYFFHNFIGLSNESHNKIHNTKEINLSLMKNSSIHIGQTAFINTLNNNFKEMMKSRKDPNKHLFFQSILWFKWNYNQWINETWKLKNKTNKIHYNPNADLSLLKPILECKFIPKKILTSSYLKKFYEQLVTTTDYPTIRNKCHDMTNYALPSPLELSDLKSWKQFDDKNAINVMILGTGPVGLYTALYLQHYYNKPDQMVEFSFRKINILLVDNRIFKEGIKMPYSRSTQFGFSIEEIQPFLQQIFCWNMEKFDIRAFDYIHVLENLLYTVAYHKKISMAFTKKFEDYETLKSFVTKENINVLFDCTGGRTQIPVSHSVRWNTFSFKEGNQEVHQNPITKYYEFWEDGKVFTTQILRLQLFGKEKHEILVGNEFAEPTDPDDIALATKYNNMCFKLEDFLVLVSQFKKEKIRYLFLHMLEVAKLKKNDIELVKIVVFDTIARHSPFVAAPFQKECTLIRLGDSLGGTEYGIVFGMKHSIMFSKHICNLLSTFL